MKPAPRILLRVLLAASALWLLGYSAFVLTGDRAIVAMILLLGVLGTAALGDWQPAVAASLSGSLAFSYYFAASEHSLLITTEEDATAFAALFVTAMVGSQLSLRALRLTREALERREEMARLHRLGSALVAAGTLQDAAVNAAARIASLFDVGGVVIVAQGLAPVRAGSTSGSEGVLRLPIDSGAVQDMLELHGTHPSEEVCQAICSLLSLVFERARGAEERAKIESSQRGDALRTTVLNALAHGFRTPLTSIKAAASALLDSGMIPDQNGRELVTVIDEEADRLDELIAESLNLARIESHRENPRREECHLPEIVEKVRRRVARYIGRREFVMDVSDTLPAITGDRFLLEQMLIQVVDNAWKYSRPGSRICVSAETDASNIILTVQNEGSEIPESERLLIFDKFYRGTGERARVEGTGLGLAIARSIAEAFQGRVWLEMEPGGPAFKFALPLKATGEKNDYQANHSVSR